MNLEEDNFELQNVVLPGQIGFDFGNRRPINKLIGQIEYYPVSRTFAFVMAVVSSILTNAGIFVFSLLKIGELPDKLPLIYNYIEKIWIQIDKFLIIAVPFLILAVEISVIFYCIRVSFIDRRLAVIALSMVSLFNILILISAIQIFSLVL